MERNKIFFGTSNKYKFEEASSILIEYGIKLELHPLKRIEIQADSLDKIARYSIQVLQTKKPIVVEDSGFFIDHYNGFPGPYSHYVLNTIGLRGVLKLMKRVKNRKANFQSCVAFKQNTTIHIFKGIIKGQIAQSIRGSHGFGYDPIFIPNEIVGTETFGEIPNNIKNSISHRAHSFSELGKWLRNQVTFIKSSSAFT